MSVAQAVTWICRGRHEAVDVLTVHEGFVCSVGTHPASHAG